MKNTNGGALVFSGLDFKTLSSKIEEATYLSFLQTNISPWLCCLLNLVLSCLIKLRYLDPVYFYLNLLQIGKKRTQVGFA